jgi:hypothetical protein
VWENDFNHMKKNLICDINEVHHRRGNHFSDQCMRAPNFPMYKTSVNTENCIEVIH